MSADAEKIAELNAIVAAVRDRVRNAQSQPENGVSPDSMPPIRMSPLDLMALVHARDAAQAKVAAIGSVNPRAGGLLNRIVQSVKKLIARSLQWFVRDQIVFNRETISALEATLEALAEQNRSFLTLTGRVNERFSALHSQMQRTHEMSAAQSQEIREMLSGQAQALHAQISEARMHSQAIVEEARELKDVRTHWIEWRAGWEQKLAHNEIYFLRSAADLQGAFQHRVTLIESNFREIVQAQHRDYLGALDRANVDIQKRLWEDLAKVRDTYERLIHTELRLIRQRAGMPLNSAAPPASAPVAPIAPSIDYGRFAERFRGSEERVRGNMEFYLPYFAGRANVLDIGCGRGEFLEVMREAGVTARGIDLSAESVAQCRDKGLDAEVADLFAYLAAQPDGEFDGILSSQVVEHLPADRVPEMIRLCGAKLRSGGMLAIETPNPECLAIFATHFYLDPTHTRPMPHQYLHFCMEEAGLTAIEVHELSQAIETMPELASLPDDFRRRFFGGLDYAIIGRRI